MAKNPYVAGFEEDYDYGFTFEDENHDHVSSLEEENLNLKARLQELHKTFKPLLENLAKNPEKPMIKWPNRKEIIERQLNRLETLTKV